MEYLKLLEKFLYEAQVEKNLSRLTLNAYKSDIIDFLSNFECSIINANKYLQNIQNLYTARRKYSSLRQWIKYLYINQIHSKDEITLLYKPKIPQSLPKAIEHSELQSLLNFKTQTLNDIRKYAFLQIMYATATRVSECINIKLPDIFDTKIKIIGKRRKERWVFLNIIAKNALHNYLSIRKHWQSNNNYLWGVKNSKLSRQTINKWLNKFPIKLTPHVFRHSQATRLLQKINIIDLAKILGHTSINTTSCYLKVKSENLFTELDHFHPLNNN